MKESLDIFFKAISGRIPENANAEFVYKSVAEFFEEFLKDLLNNSMKICGGKRKKKSQEVPGKISANILKLSQQIFFGEMFEGLFGVIS